MPLTTSQTLDLLKGALAGLDLENDAKRVPPPSTSFLDLVDRLSQLEHDLKNPQATRLIAMTKLFLAVKETGDRPLDQLETQFIELCHQVQGLR